MAGRQIIITHSTRALASRAAPGRPRIDIEISGARHEHAIAQHALSICSAHTSKYGFCGWIVARKTLLAIYFRHNRPVARKRKYFSIAYDVTSGLLRGLDYSVQSQWDIAIVAFLEVASAIAQRYFLFKQHSEKIK